MKAILIDLDERSARDLERVAPAKKRMRAEFIRIAIRRAIDLALDRATEQAYRAQPMADDLTTADLLAWDERNALARPARAQTRAARRGQPKSAA